MKYPRFAWQLSTYQIYGVSYVLTKYVIWLPAVVSHESVNIMAKEDNYEKAEVTGLGK